MSRMDQYAVAVTVGETDLGIFDKMSGGAKDSNERKYKPGGLAPEVSLGGQATVTNITVERLYVRERDHNELPMLLAAVGKARVSIKKQPLDADGAPYGSPVVYTGVLKQVTPPEVDSESSDPAMLSLEVTPEGAITAA